MWPPKPNSFVQFIFENSYLFVKHKLLPVLENPGEIDETIDQELHKKL